MRLLAVRYLRLFLFVWDSWFRSIGITWDRTNWWEIPFSLIHQCSHIEGVLKLDWVDLDLKDLGLCFRLASLPPDWILWNWNHQDIPKRVESSNPIQRVQCNALKGWITGTETFGRVRMELDTVFMYSLNPYHRFFESGFVRQGLRHLMMGS